MLYEFLKWTLNFKKNPYGNFLNFSNFFFNCEQNFFSISMTSWKKVFCTLNWTIHEIDLHRPMMSDYIFKWEIESDKKEKDKLKPNNQNKIKFDFNDERELTFYINKKDSTIRPKKLKLFLFRLKDNNKEKLYGKLIIDIAKFYQKDESTNVVVRDMESGRSIAPTFNGSFIINTKSEDNQELNGDSINEISFKIDSDTDFPLSEWDISFIADDNELSNNNNEMKKINNKKSQTLAEDAEFIKETDEIEKKKYQEILNIYNKQQALKENDEDSTSNKNATESKIQSNSSASAEISEEELEKDREIENTKADQKEEESQNEEDMLENENVLTANDDDIDEDIFQERKRTVEIAEREGEKEDFPELSYTEVIKKKKKYMVIKEAKTDDDTKYRVELNQGAPGGNITRQRRVTFNLSDNPQNQNDEDYFAAVKKKIAEDSGNQISPEEINSKFRVIDRRSSLTYEKPGIDSNSVGAKVNLGKPAQPRLSVPTITLNITPGVKLGTVGVQNLNLPSRENSSVNSSSSSPRNRDLADSSETKIEDSDSKAELSDPLPSSNNLTPQENSNTFSPPQIRKSYSALEPFPPPLISPGVGAGTEVGVKASPSAQFTPGNGSGVSVGVNNLPGVGVTSSVGVDVNKLPGVGVTSSVGVDVNKLPGVGVNNLPGVGARPGVAPGINNLSGVGIRSSVGVPLMNLPNVGVRSSVGVSSAGSKGAGVGAPPGTGIGTVNIPNVPSTSGVGAGAGIGHGTGILGSNGIGAPAGVASGAGNLPGVQIGAPSMTGANVGPNFAGVNIGAPPNVGVRSAQPTLMQDLAAKKRMTQPTLNNQNTDQLGNLNPNTQAYSANTTPRNNNPSLVPNPILINQSNPIRQSTQPNQLQFKYNSESGTASEPLDEESGSTSTMSMNSQFPSLQQNPQLRQQILLQQQKIQQQQQQLQFQNQNRHQPVQLRLPPNVTNITSSTNPNFNVPMIPGLPNGNYSTSGSVSPRSPTTASPIPSESANEVSDEASMSTASLGSPRNQSTSTSASLTPTPTPTPNTEAIPKASFNTFEIPGLQPGHQQYVTTRRRSSMVSVPVGNLPAEVQQQIGPNSEMKNVEVEYEYEYEYDEFDDENQNAEDQKRKAEIRAAEEKKMESNFSYCLHVIITHQWRMMTNPPKFAPDRAYPCQVFPIFATILHTQILKSEKSIKPQQRHQHQVNFDKCLQIFATDMQKMPATHSDLFLTILLIILLIRTQGPKYRLDRKRCETALKTIQHMFESSLLLILERPLDKAEVFIEIFSEANFQQTKLLMDFHEIFESNKTAFMYGEVINNFLITRFTELLEGKMLNRIISKPDKFTFSNAVKWNSFLTAFENDNNISMKTIHQAVNVFIMIESIAKSPSLAKEVCPDISPALVSFFITHFKKDENIQNPPKPSKFNKEYKLNKAPKVFEHVPSKKTSLTLTTIKQEFTLNNWNDLSPEEPNVKDFSFLVKYIKLNETPVAPTVMATQDVS